MGQDQEAARGGADRDDLQRTLDRARDRLDRARRKAERASRAHYYGDRPADETRDDFHSAMREEAEAALDVEDAQRALERAKPRRVPVKEAASERQEGEARAAQGTGEEGLS